MAGLRRDATAMSIVGARGRKAWADAAFLEVSPCSISFYEYLYLVVEEIYPHFQEDAVHETG